MSEVIEPLSDTVNALGLRGDARDWSNLRLARDLWALYARSMNLVGPGQVEQQMAESLHLVAAIERHGAAAGHWVDVGSGGGFPGLVVAGWFEGEGLMIEPRAKRCEFLELALGRMGLSGWRVVRGRFERGGVVQASGGWVSLGKLGVVAVRGCSARAVFSPEVWVGEASRMLPLPGVVAVHLHAGGPDPAGLEPCARADGVRWSVRLYDGDEVRRRLG